MGAEILFLMLLGPKDFFVVKLLDGIGAEISEAALLLFVVKARASDIFAEWNGYPDFLEKVGEIFLFSQMYGCTTVELVLKVGSNVTRLFG